MKKITLTFTLTLFFKVIIAKQFNKLKFADAYYFENGEDTKNRFTLKQLDSIRKYTVAKLQCNNINNQHTQGNSEDLIVFTSYGFLVEYESSPGLNPESNLKIDCSKLDDIMFDLWKEAKPVASY